MWGSFNLRVSATASASGSPPEAGTEPVVAAVMTDLLPGRDLPGRVRVPMVR